MMNCTIFCFCSILNAGIAPEADTARVSMQMVLASARTEERVRLQQGAVGYLVENPMHLPVFDELEFRLGPDDLYFDEQRIAFRFSTHGLSEIKRQRTVNAVELERLSAEAALLVEEGLFERYNALSDARFCQQMAGTLRRLEGLEDDRSQIYSYLIEKGIAVDAIKLVEAEEDWQDARSELRQWEDKAALVEERIRQYLGSTAIVQPDFENMVRVETIVRRLAETTETPATAEISLKMIESRLSEAQWRLTLSRKFNVLNFVQVDYRDRPEPFDFKSEFSARIGLNIPIAGGDKPKAREQALEWELDKNEYQTELADQKQKCAALRSKLGKLANQYQADQERWQKSAIRKLLAKPELLNQLTGDDLLQLQIAREKQTIREIEQAYEIRLVYVEYVLISGGMNGGVLRNALSEGMEGI
ncbi:MAG: hypothetical protein SH848_02910 [Saprospiraceae bacterium]|mgnify:CR=1 FL=1|nr:hypothetical protein [Saprospiraceae bacterium]